MAFQSTVQIQLGFGIAGELFDDGPVRAAPWELNSSSAAYNIVGATAFTAVSPDPGDGSGSGVAQAGGTGAFVGILFNPKVYANFGTTGNTLGATMQLPNFTMAELCTMGDLFVAIPGPANVGDRVVYDLTSGALSTVPDQAQFTGSIAITTGILTVSAIAQGQLAVGSVISGTGVPPLTVIESLGTGKGGSGTYNTNITPAGAIASTAMTAPNVPPSAASFTAQIVAGMSGAPDTLTVSAVASGELSVGQVISGTGVAANTVITAYGTGVGGTGNYSLSTSGQTVASESMSTDATAFVPNARVIRYAPPGATVGVIALTN